ncbi:hypothetical protein MAUB_34230 [Mycolicibacterium aubagnense]|uniref:Uncharacterized protein n=1 Tax=Mycolicibacterium aubagnense TaxID=319707 RepID=A0ABN5YUU4_9MYCO|nr:hypothetical protein MAUB_34230 [Mycolicibacterium aubagnense]
MRARAGAGFVDTDARIECGIDEITDRVDDDDHWGAKQSDEAAADRWAERLSGRVSLIQARIRCNQSRPGHQARQQRLRGGESENRECTKRQKRDREHPYLQLTNQPQDGNRTQTQCAPDASPYQNRLAPPPIGVRTGNEAEHGIRHQLSRVHDADLKRGGAKQLDH